MTGEASVRTPRAREVIASQVRYQLDDAVHAWKRSSHEPGTLAVVDPVGVGDAVERALARIGVRLDVCPAADVALARLASVPPRAVVLSATAVTADAAGFVTRLRHQHGLAVLLALGPGDVERATAAIVAGASPVLDLPLRPAQLVVRLQRVWVDRPRTPTVIRLGGLELDEARKDARLFGQTLGLTAAEYELMWLLAQHQGRAVRRRDLWALWPGAEDQDGTLVAAVVRLRRKLTNRGFEGVIRTVRGVGYGLDFPTGWYEEPRGVAPRSAVGSGR